MPNFTKQAIKAAFLKLLNEMPLNKISVRSIVEECGINRNSFYYHYQDIPALIEEIAKDEIDSIIAKYPTINTIDECLNLAFRFAVENKRAVLHIYNSISRDIYVRNLMDICEYVVRTYLDTAFGRDVVSEYDRAVTFGNPRIYVFGFIQRATHGEFFGRNARFVFALFIAYDYSEFVAGSRQNFFSSRRAARKYEFTHI